MDVNIEALARKGMDLLETSMMTIFSNLPEENAALKEEFLTSYLHLCQREIEASIHREALQSVKTLAKPTEESIKQTYDSKYSEGITRASSPTSHPKYLEMIEKVNSSAVKCIDFDRIEAELSKENARLDPFTKKPIETPVKNKYCGHVYDKASVEEILRIQGPIKCPVAGCMSKNSFRVTDLIIVEEETLMSETQELN